MKRCFFPLVLACLIAHPAMSLQARAYNQHVKALHDRAASSERAVTSSLEDTYFNDLHLGALWFPSLSNRGYVGYYRLSGFYPGGGSQSTVWNAGMWAGGYVEGREHAWFFNGADGHHSDPAMFDNLNEQAVLASETDLGVPYPCRRLTVHVNSAEKPDIGVDGDMGLDVTYRWHQWGIRGYDNWVFVHVRIEFAKDIDTFYWAWMSDCDVGDVNLPEWYFDDFAGRDDSLVFCYMRDYDYDPLPLEPSNASTEDVVFLSPGAVGQYLLAAPPAGGPVTATPDPNQKWTTLNYWDWRNDVSGSQDAYDRMSGNWQNTFPSPEPFDYRILSAVGPYQVSAGDTAHFWMAYVVGEGYDDDAHASHNLGTLVDHVADAQDFYDGGMVIPAHEIPPQTPDLNPDLEADITGDTLRVHWAPYQDIPGGVHADSFFVHTSTTSGLGPWERIAGLDGSAREIHLSLEAACTYVWVQAYDTGNETGSNPYALHSRLYQRDTDGIIRADDETIICAPSPQAGIAEIPGPEAGGIQIRPNPPGPSATIMYSIITPGEFSLRVYDVSGALVRSLADGDMGAGIYQTSWDGRDSRGGKSPPGVYFLRLTTQSSTTTARVILLR